MKIKWILFFSAFVWQATIAQTIPSPKSFLGYEIGRKFTPHHQLVAYFEALAKAAPGNIKMERYGQTNGGRPLMLAFISSSENLVNLENIRKNNLWLTGLETGNGQPDGKAIVWLSYNVHGNEASSSEAAILTTHHLLTSPESREWLKNTVVIIDPCLNPDGRDRYVNWFSGVVGATENPDPQTREHSEPWPGGRSNYYYFDLNRDWAWQTQVETRTRMQQYLKWMPHVHVDFHEQGYNEPYYFAPAAEPFHEVITPWQREFQTKVGKNNARYFDQNGWLYFTRERFDLFYPSYGDTWPTYNGAIGMTYEQGGHSRGGLAVTTDDGEVLTLRDRAQHHHTTGLSTIEVSSLNAADLQRNFQSYFQKAQTAGVGPYQTFVVKGQASKAKLEPLKKLLTSNGIQVKWSNGGGKIKGYNYFTGNDETFNLEKGDLLIHTAQPMGNMAKVLFEPKSKLADSATYDITSWALPYAYGLQSYAVTEKLPAVAALAEPAIALLPPDANAYGYVKNWESLADARFLADCLQKGLKVRVAEKPFVMNGKTYSAGSLIFIRTNNKGIESFNQQVLKIADNHGIRVDAVKTGFAENGADFGSPDVKMIKAPRVAVLTGDEVSSLAAGEVWYYFDQELKYPASLIDSKDADRIDWRRYDVVILPNARFKTLLKKDGPLQTWVRQGGKLIAMESAVEQLASMDWGLSSKKENEEKNDPEDYALLKKFENREKDELSFFNPGSVFKVELDPSHPLAFGYGTTYFTLKNDIQLYEFSKSAWNVGVVKKESQMAGFLGAKVKSDFKDGLLFGELPMGRGSVVFLSDNVLFRNFWQNGKLMFANAVFLVNQDNGFTL